MPTKTADSLKSELTVIDDDLRRLDAQERKAEHGIDGGRPASPDGVA